MASRASSTSTVTRTSCASARGENYDHQTLRTQFPDYPFKTASIGVIPLYLGRDAHGNLHVASELKALVGFCRHLEDFPPGHYLTSGMERRARYYHPGWRRYEDVAGMPLDLARLRGALEAAVHQPLMCDVPYGVLAVPR